ncbi:MAG: hypothetical protein AAFV62_04040 [Pseudomonadota bacterium]
MAGEARTIIRVPRKAVELPADQSILIDALSNAYGVVVYEHGERLCFSAIEARLAPKDELGVTRIAAPLTAWYVDGHGALHTLDAASAHPPAVQCAILALAREMHPLFASASLTRLIDLSGFSIVREVGFYDRLLIAETLCVFSYEDPSEAVEASHNATAPAETIVVDEVVGARICSIVIDRASAERTPTAHAVDLQTAAQFVSAGSATFDIRLEHGLSNADNS